MVPQALLLDDDDLILRAWALAAKQAGIRLATFSDPALFLEALAALPREAELYVDAQLAAGVRGEEIAQRAHDLGFRSIFLATGLPPDSFAHLTWLAGVVGKDPPWALLA